GDTLADSFTVTTADGTTQLVTVTINGTNDAPVIGGVTSGAVSEDTSLSVSGALTITDADAGEAVFQAVSGAASTNGYGTFDVVASGNGTYTLLHSFPAGHALELGDTLADSFT